MKDELAELILEQVEAVLERDPSEDALFDLLRIASPKISRESLTDEKFYKKLLERIHIDKKRPLYKRAEKLTKSLDGYYRECITYMKQQSGRKRSLNDEERNGENSTKKSL